MRILKACLFASLACGLVACSDKAKDPDEPGNVSGTMEQLTPSESKKFLEQTGNDFLGYFKAADQQDVIKLAAFCSEEYGDLEMPREFEIEETVNEADPMRMIRAFAATAQGHATRAGSYSIQYSYMLDFDKFKGIYKPGGNRWTKFQDSDHIIFQFVDANGQNCELKAELGKDNSTGSISYTDEYYDYWYDEETVEEYVYNFRIPKTINITLTQNGKTLASSKVDSKLDVKGHEINVTANVNVANIAASVKVDGKDTKVTQSSSLSVGGTNLVSTTATVNGNHLCDYDYYVNNEDDARDMLAGLLDSGTATVSVLDKVRIDAKATYSTALYNALNTYYDNYEFSSQADAIKAVTNALATLNNNVEALVRYNNKETVQARLFWDYDLDEYGYNYWEYYITPLLKFDSDGTTYSFEEYFERGFTSVEDTWEDLVSSYEKVWNSGKPKH